MLGKDKEKEAVTSICLVASVRKTVQAWNTLAGAVQIRELYHRFRSGVRDS